MKSKTIAVEKSIGQKTLTTKDLFSKDSVKEKFKEMLGKKSQGFITSVLQIVSSNSYLTNADPMSVYNAAAIAATMDLPLNNNLGFAYIVPYNQKFQDVDGQWKSKQVAQFQMGYKGFIQLAQRSGQFKTISASPIFEGQLIEQNPLTGFLFDFTKKLSDTVIGYAGYFSLINGFEKTIFMTISELNNHGIKFSQTFKKGQGLWKDNFDSMATKTVIKLLLSKYAPLSIEMQRAVITDQAIINDVETEDVTYVDNTQIAPTELTQVEQEHDRQLQMLNDCNTIKDVQELCLNNPDIDSEMVDERISELEKQGGKKK